MCAVRSQLSLISIFIHFSCSTLLYRTHFFLAQRERKNDALAEKKKKKKGRCRML